MRLLGWKPSQQSQRRPLGRRGSYRLEMMTLPGRAGTSAHIPCLVDWEVLGDYLPDVSGRGSRATTGWMGHKAQCSEGGMCPSPSSHPACLFTVLPRHIQAYWIYSPEMLLLLIDFYKLKTEVYREDKLSILVESNIVTGPLF